MVSLILALGCAGAPEPRSVLTAAVEPRPGPGTYAYALDRVDASIRAAEQRAVRYDNDWARWAEVAALWTARARLTGDYADFGRAEDAYAVAFAMAPAGSGPRMGRAGLHFALHRLDAASADLDAAARQHLDANQQASLLRMRGDIAFQRGGMDEAQGLYERSLALHDSLAARYGVAQVAWWRGDHDRALRLLDDCEALVRGDQPSTRMWLALQRGLVELDRGRYEAALAQYRAADAHVSGHWLVREHIAEVTRALGRPDEALAMYEEIVLETHHPEFMDAVASILAERGDAAGAARWVAWAGAGFERQLTLYPEAAAGHALDHYLAWGDDGSGVAVRLAERNVAARPNGEALTKLATAYRLAGRLGDARAALERAAATGFVSPRSREEAEEVLAATR